MSDLPKHSRQAEIDRLCELIRSADPAITEHVKWNAPSFCIDGDDRVTLRLQPKDRVQIIVHRGAKVKDTTGFHFADESGLIRWLAPDRGEITIADAADLEAEADTIRKLVKRWMDATR